MPNSSELVKRSDKIAFMNTGTAQAPVYTRMRKFTTLSNSKNATEYSRRYVDEETETTDVTGYSAETSYAFDQYTNNPVHAKIADISDNEKTGDAALVDILIVDKSEVSGEGYVARKRQYSVIPDSDGDSNDAYTYSGKLKAHGTFEETAATISADGLTATEIEDGE